MSFRITKVSTFGLNQNSTNSALGIQKQMAEAQQRLATGVKNVTFQGYGVQSLMIQSYRAELENAQAYIDNIDRVSTDIKQMDTALEQVFDQLEIVIGQSSINPQEGTPDTQAMRSLARNAREIIIDVMNTKIGNRHLFAGSDVSNAPYEDAANLDARVSQELNNWLDQTNDADDLIANVDNLTQSQTGFSLSIQSAGNIRARADDNYEVDYTVKANQEPFQDIMKALSVFMQLDVPDPDTDLATLEQYYEIENNASTSIINALQELRQSSAKLANASQAIGKKREDHVAQRAQFLTLMESVESIDPAQEITRFQSLSTQLETSYRAVSIIQNLSLSQFI